MRREQSAIRWFARWLVLVAVLALGISACGEREARIDTGPQVRLKVGDATYAEPVYSYCWPQTGENVACDVNLTARAQPEHLAPVAPGEPISFDVDEAAQNPQAITVTLLDGPGGQTDLTATSAGATFTSPTEPGQYRVQVDVQYAEVSGSEAYVSYVFGLDVQAAAVAAAPTETPVEAGPETATEAATEQPTEEPTLEPTAAPSETPAPLPSPTAAPTLTPQATATEMITETAEVEVTETEEAVAIAQATEKATEVVTEAATEEPTETPVTEVTAEPTAEVTAELTEAATEEVVTREAATPTSEPAVTEEATKESTPEPAEEPVSSPTLESSLGSVTLLGNVRVVRDRVTVPLANAIVIFTYRSASDPSRNWTAQATTDDTGRFAFEPVELNEADTIGLTISAAGYSTQEIELSGADAYSLPVLNLILLPITMPTPTPTPTAPPTVTPVPVEPTPTATPVAPPTAYPSGAPLLYLAYAGRVFEPLGYQLCLPDNTGALTECVQEPTGTAERRRLTLMRGAAAQLLIAGERPSNVHIEYLTDTGVKTGQPEDSPGHNTILFTVTPEPGLYILAVSVTWDAQHVTYYFRVAVSG